MLTFLHRDLFVALEPLDGDRFEADARRRIVLQHVPERALRQAEQVRIADGTDRRRAPVSGVTHVQDTDLAEVAAGLQIRQDGLAVRHDDLQFAAANYVHFFADFACEQNGRPLNTGR